MAKLPFMKFFPSDWIQDTGVLSLSAQGAWLKLICAMWISPKPGVLRWPMRDFRRYLSAETDACDGCPEAPPDEPHERILTELFSVAEIHLYTFEDEETKEISNASHLTITCHRVVRDWAAWQKEQDRKDQWEQEHRKPRRSPDENPTETRRNPTPRSQKSEDRSQTLKKKTKTTSESRAKEPGAVAVAKQIIKIREQEFEWPTPEALVALYNHEASDDLPSITVLTEQRKVKARKYLNKFPKVEFWREVFQETKKSSLLRGLNASPGHQGFNGNLDWLLTVGKDQTENAVKVFEGRYRDKK